MIKKWQAWMAVVVLSMATSNTAAAEIKDYELLRFLYLDTECGRSTIVTRELVDDVLAVTANCQNQTAFPDGAAVTCSDKNDVRTCTLSNRARSFDSLELLRRKDEN